MISAGNSSEVKPLPHLRDATPTEYNKENNKSQSNESSLKRISSGYNSEQGSIWAKLKRIGRKESLAIKTIKASDNKSANTSFISQFFGCQMCCSSNKGTEYSRGIELFENSKIIRLKSNDFSSSPQIRNKNSYSSSKSGSDYAWKNKPTSIGSGFMHHPDL